ncbi:MAG: DNA polymerase III subunit gamma/tau [Bacteroidales bacterium]|nr:DNA polymerase III subunit gamma/tau [Bacteroidales bacterium]
MSEYIVSARKYRPDSFESLIGQDIIAQTLKNSVQRGQLAHAYLFCGPRGVGKTSTARIFAKTINCSNPGPDLEPCGHCESCESFQEGRSYCIYELDAASNNSVEDIKALMEKVQVPPQVGKYSVYIIDEVHMLSQAAFNAFLKTLEEPPSYAIFILCTTEKHKVLPTILSRCQTYDFNRIGVSDIVRNLKAIASKEGINADDASLHVIAQKADGAMRDALTIFDQTVAFCGTDIKYEDVIRNLGILDYEYSFRLVDAFLVKDYASALLILDEVLRKGFNALHFISALGEHLRDLLVCRTGGLEALVELPDSMKTKYREQAGRCSVKFIYDALGIVSECEAGYKGSVNQRLHIEYALMRLAFLGGVPVVGGQAGGSERTVGGSVSGGSSAPKEPHPTTGEAGGPPASGPRAARPSGPTVPAQPAAETPAKAAPAAEPVKAPQPAAETQAKAAPAAEPVKAPQPATEAQPQEARPAAPATPAAPAATAAPAAAPVAAAAAKTSHRSGVGSRFASILNGDASSEVRQEQGPAVGNNLPSEDAVKAAWPTLVEKVAAGRRQFMAALNAAPLKVFERDGKRIVDFQVVNAGQKNWIEERFLKSMTNQFCEMLGSSRVEIEISVLPETKVEKRAYTPEEQARELMDSNPEVRSLVQDMSLDVR